MGRFIFCTDNQSCFELLSKLMGFDIENEFISSKGMDAKILFIPAGNIGIELGGPGRQFHVFNSRSIEYILNYRMNVPEEITKLLNDEYLHDSEIVNAFESNESGQHRFNVFSKWFRLSEKVSTIYRVWFDDLTETSVRKELNNVQSNSDFESIAQGKLCEETVKLFFKRHAAEVGWGRELLLPADIFILSNLYRREIEFELSQKSSYYIIQTKLDDYSVTYYHGSGDTKIVGIQALEETLTSLRGKSLLILKANKRFRKVSVPLLYNKADLLEHADLGDPEDTLTALEILYSRGYISNPHTTSRHMWSGSEEAAGGILARIQENPDYSTYVDYMFKANNGPIINHEVFNSDFVDRSTGIVPTGKSIKNDHLLREEVQSVYDCIVKRFLKQFLGEQVLFKVELVGKITETEGFMRDHEEVFQHGHDIADMEPEEVLEILKHGAAPSKLDAALEYSVGMRVQLGDMTVLEKSAKGVSRLKKQGLLKLMSMPGKRGIRGKTAKILRRNYGVGEAGERISIIENLSKRALIHEDVVSHEYTLTEMGREALMSCLAPLTETKTVAYIYTQIQGIKAGVVEAQDFMKRCMVYFEDMIQNSPRLKDAVSLDLAPILKRLKCPNCENKLEESVDTIKCGSCGFHFMKAYRKYQLSEIDVVNLLKYGETGNVEINTPLSKRGSYTFKLIYDRTNKCVLEIGSEELTEKQYPDATKTINYGEID